MNTKSFELDTAYAALQQQLQAVAQQLRAGMDVPPAQRLRLEGIAATLIANGANIEVLARDCVAAGAGAIVVERAGDVLHFDCWQQRAPVYPTTAD